MPLHVAKFIIHNSQVLAWLFWAALVVYVSCIVRWAALALQTKLRGVREFSNETSEKRLGTPWYIFMLAGAVLAAVIFLEGTASERVEQYEKCISWFSALDVIAKEDKA